MEQARENGFLFVNLKTMAFLMKRLKNLDIWTKTEFFIKTECPYYSND